MKIAIVSDSHDNEVNINKVVSWLNKNKIKYVIHCGDTASMESLKLFEKFNGKVYIVMGNADYDEILNYKSKKIKVFKETGETEIDGLKLGFCHRNNLAKKLADSGKYDYVFFGHTHLPTQKFITVSGKLVQLVNPGTLAGMFAQPTFAILDSQTKKLELIFIHKL